MQEFSLNKDTPFKEQFDAKSTHFSLVTHLWKHREEITALQMVQERLCTPSPPSVKFPSKSFIVVQLDKGLAFFFLTFFSSPSSLAVNRHFSEKKPLKRDNRAAITT